MLLEMQKKNNKKKKFICCNKRNITVKYKYRNTLRATREAKAYQMLAALLTHRTALKLAFISV